MRDESWDEAIPRLAELAEEIETTQGRIRILREGRPDLVLLTADELASLEETLFWQQDGLERSAAGEPVDHGEYGPGLDEAEVRSRYSSLLGPNSQPPREPS